MCKKAKFLLPKFRSLEPNTPDVHYHTHSTLLMYDKVPAKTICYFIITTSQVFPGLLEKVFYKTSPLSGLILLH